jgi:hypothetical protein
MLAVVAQERYTITPAEFAREVGDQLEQAASLPG